MTIAVDIDQKPPMDTPRRARPTINMAPLTAKVTNRPDTISRILNPSSTSFRSKRPVRGVLRRLAATAKNK
jgi:hypothetical protein